MGCNSNFVFSKKTCLTTFPALPSKIASSPLTFHYPLTHIYAISYPILSCQHLLHMHATSMNAGTLFHYLLYPQYVECSLEHNEFSINTWWIKVCKGFFFFLIVCLNQWHMEVPWARDWIWAMLDPWTHGATLGTPVMAVFKLNSSVGWNLK